MASQVVQDEPKELAPINHDSNTPNTDGSETDAKKQSDIEQLAKPPAPAAGPGPPPNGGLLAWLQVAAGFILFFNTWGMLSTFPVFQTYYETGELFLATSTNISWIGSIQCFLLQLTGLIAGPVYDREYIRLLLLSGSFLIFSVS